MKKLTFIALAATMLLTGCATETGIATTVESTEVFCIEDLPTDPQETLCVVTATESVAEASTVEYHCKPTEYLKKHGEEGYVSSRSGLNIRKLPGINNPKVGQLSNGDRVIIIERSIEDNTEWGRIEQGWVCMDYIVMGQPVPCKPPILVQDHVNSDSVTAPDADDRVPETLLPNTSEESTENITFPTMPSDEETFIPDNTESPAAPDEGLQGKPDLEDSAIPTEPAVTEHRHDWYPIKTIPATYETRSSYTCKCGYHCATLEEWYAHRDNYIDTEDLSLHTGWTKEEQKIKTCEERIEWACTGCSDRRILDFDLNP